MIRNLDLKNVELDWCGWREGTPVCLWQILVISAWLFSNIFNILRATRASRTRLLDEFGPRQPRTKVKTVLCSTVFTLVRVARIELAS